MAMRLSSRVALTHWTCLVHHPILAAPHHPFICCQLFFVAVFSYVYISIFLILLAFSLPSAWEVRRFSFVLAAASMTTTRATAESISAEIGLFLHVDPSRPPHGDHVVNREKLLALLESIEFVDATKAAAAAAAAAANEAKNTPPAGAIFQHAHGEREQEQKKTQLLRCTAPFHLVFGHGLLLQRCTEKDCKDERCKDDAVVCLPYFASDYNNANIRAAMRAMQSVFYSRFGWLLWRQVCPRRVALCTSRLSNALLTLPAELCQLIADYRLMPTASRKEELRVQVQHYTRLDGGQSHARLYFRFQGVLLEQCDERCYFAPVFTDAWLG